MSLLLNFEWLCEALAMHYYHQESQRKHKEISEFAEPTATKMTTESTVDPIQTVTSIVQSQQQ